MKCFILFSIYIVAVLVFVGCNPPTGPKGAAGVDGKPGTSCSVVQLENGALIQCGDQTTAVILNGSIGPKGEDMTPGPYEVFATINPCGKQGSHDEVLLRIGSGELLAHYSEGKKEFLTVVGPGTYQTTDGTKCNFTVDQNLDVTWEGI